MARWAAFPYADARYEYTPATLKKQWSRLHRGDCEPFPKDDEVIAAWIDYHAALFATQTPAGPAARPRSIASPKRPA